MQNKVRQQLRDLQSAGWDAEKNTSVSFNHGSETFAHARCKFVAGWYYHQQGYRVNSEVEMEHGEVDILAYNDEESIVVECETSPTRDVVRDKVKRYITGEPPRDCFVLNVNDMPVDAFEALSWVEDQV